MAHMGIIMVENPTPARGILDKIPRASKTAHGAAFSSKNEVNNCLSGSTLYAFTCVRSNSPDQKVCDVVQRGHDLGPRRLGPSRPQRPLALPEPHPDAAAGAARPRPVPRLEVVVQGSPAVGTDQDHVGGACVNGGAAATDVELEVVGQVAAVGLELQQQKLRKCRQFITELQSGAAG